MSNSPIDSNTDPADVAKKLSDHELKSAVSECVRLLRKLDPKKTQTENVYLKQLLAPIKGTLKYKDGSYEGMILGGVPHGKGKRVWTDGGSYNGEWVAGRMEGKGVEITSNGQEYIGDFKGGKKDGMGTIYFPNGNKFVGILDQGKMHGPGLYTFATGALQFCEFKEGKQHGHCFEVNPDRDTMWYSQFADGVLKGEMVEFSYNKTVLTLDGATQEI